MRIWKSADGRWRINLAQVTSVYLNNNGNVDVWCAGGHCGTLGASDGESLCAALDAADETTDVRQLDQVLIRLNLLRGDMGTVGGNALVDAMRELIILLRGGSVVRP